MYRKTVIIINISRSKRVNEQIIYLCTSCHENVPACAVSWSLALRLLSFVSSTWIRRRRNMKNYNIAFVLISHTIYNIFSLVS